MTRKRYKKHKPKVSNPNSRYRKLMRYVEPKVFYEDNYFSPDAPDADTWRECWIAEKVMLGLAGIAAYFHIWWLLPILLVLLLLGLAVLLGGTAVAPFIYPLF